MKNAKIHNATFWAIFTHCELVKRGHLNFKIQSSEFSIVAYHFPVSMQSKLLLLYIIWWGRNDCGMHLSKPPFKMLLLKNVGSIKTLTIKWMFCSIRWWSNILWCRFSVLIQSWRNYPKCGLGCEKKGEQQQWPIFDHKTTMRKGGLQPLKRSAKRHLFSKKGNTRR